MTSPVGDESGWKEKMGMRKSGRQSITGFGEKIGSTEKGNGQ
jgi:hypothetical protein